MKTQEFLGEPSRVDEPHLLAEYSEVLSRVAADGRPVIVPRNGEDLAAVIPLADLEKLGNQLRARTANGWPPRSTGIASSSLIHRRRSGLIATA